MKESTKYKIAWAFLTSVYLIVIPFIPEKAFWPYIIIFGIGLFIISGVLWLIIDVEKSYEDGK